MVTKFYFSPLPKDERNALPGMMSVNVIICEVSVNCPDAEQLLIVSKEK